MYAGLAYPDCEEWISDVTSLCNSSNTSSSHTAKTTSKSTSPDIPSLVVDALIHSALPRLLQPAVPLNVVVMAAAGMLRLVCACSPEYSSASHASSTDSTQGMPRLALAKLCRPISQHLTRPHFKSQGIAEVGKLLIQSVASDPSDVYVSLQFMDPVCFLCDPYPNAEEPMYTPTPYTGDTPLPLALVDPEEAMRHALQSMCIDALSQPGGPGKMERVRPLWERAKAGLSRYISDDRLYLRLDAYLIEAESSRRNVQQVEAARQQERESRGSNSMRAEESESEGEREDTSSVDADGSSRESEGEREEDAEEDDYTDTPPCHTMIVSRRWDRVEQGREELALPDILESSYTGVGGVGILSGEEPKDTDPDNSMILPPNLSHAMRESHDVWLQKFPVRNLRYIAETPCVRMRVNGTPYHVSLFEASVLELCTSPDCGGVVPTLCTPTQERERVAGVESSHSPLSIDAICKALGLGVDTEAGRIRVHRCLLKWAERGALKRVGDDFHVA
ncbi:hypothetical protein KIPB_007643 [Kipferlia bialata]|uniref:Uncharacterized protein n=1 Tax=Kipferlia bialata TaxID=797122 RepID=A0A9K3D0K0_9EUKA|nr:hypothetical protein KIPB_007643 [Kipferlia bialata]|eukprot:g7643.t1